MGSMGSMGSMGMGMGKVRTLSSEFFARAFPFVGVLTSTSHPQSRLIVATIDVISNLQLVFVERPLQSYRCQAPHVISRDLEVPLYGLWGPRQL